MMHKYLSGYYAGGLNEPLMEQTQPIKRNNQWGFELKKQSWWWKGNAYNSINDNLGWGRATWYKMVKTERKHKQKNSSNQIVWWFRDFYNIKRGYFSGRIHTRRKQFCCIGTFLKDFCFKTKSGDRLEEIMLYLSIFFVSGNPKMGRKWRVTGEINYVLVWDFVSYLVIY